MAIKRRKWPIMAAYVAGLAAFGGATSVDPAAADDPALASCIDAVGTFLSTNAGEQMDGTPYAGRSLISLTNGGHAFLTDSGEARKPGFSPFSDGRGAWRCVSHTETEQRIAATILDFTFPASAQDEQRIARVDIDATLDTTSGELSGTMLLSFVPLDGDPMDPAALQEASKGAFTAVKVSAR